MNEHNHAPETVLQFQNLIAAPDGSLYEARACGSHDAGELWQGWIEFVPVGGGDPVRSPRETTQPNRTDTVYWATGLTPVYLEGALRRALDASLPVPSVPPQPTVFTKPPVGPRAAGTGAAPASILDPFSVIEKGEALLRRQLAAMSAWHLVNIALEYQLTDLDVEALNRMPAAQLIEVIVEAVRKGAAARRHPA